MSAEIDTDLTPDAAPTQAAIMLAEDLGLDKMLVSRIAVSLYFVQHKIMDGRDDNGPALINADELLREMIGYDREHARLLGLIIQNGFNFQEMVDATFYKFD